MDFINQWVEDRETQLGKELITEIKKLDNEYLNSEIRRKEGWKVQYIRERTITLLKIGKL